MTFTLTPAEFQQLDARLISSHQVLIHESAETDSVTTGSISTIDGKVAADFTFTGSKNSLEVNLTKHDGYPGFIANAGLKSKLNDALQAIRSGR